MKWAEADKIKISPLTWVNKILLKHFTHLQLIVSTLNLGWALFWETKCSDKLSCQTVLCYSLIFITALLKRVLSADCCIWDDCDRWMALLLGFKRMFVSKKEILVTSATQCLIMIASNPKHARVLQLVLRTSHLPPRVLSWRPLAVGMPGLQSVFDDDLSHVWDLWNIAFEICMKHNNNNREFMEHFWRLKVHYSSYSTYK